MTVAGILCPAQIVERPCSSDQMTTAISRLSPAFTCPISCPCTTSRCKLSSAPSDVLDNDGHVTTLKGRSITCKWFGVSPDYCQSKHEFVYCFRQHAAELGEYPAHELR